uniref:Thrombospondin type-1 domain-containing protein 7A n=1 Tax=Scleropages formosus TaxID=113540 RepID=A0A8C9U5U9_SCLFO
GTTGGGGSQTWWGRCVGEDCGPGGVQSRTVRCIHSEGWTAHPSSCPPAQMPEQQRRCFRPCDWQQELFEWEASEWGPCALAPRGPSSAGAGPGTRQAECVTAQHGVQQREVRCVRASNRSAVTERVCEFFSRRPAEEQACLVPCPRPCVVSQFSSWSGCSRTCGAGLQHRTRAVLAGPVYGGAGCPNLTQTRPCENLRSCPTGEGEHHYSLRVGPWSECRLPHHKDLFLSGRTLLDFSADTAARNSVKRHVHTVYHHRHHQHPHHLRNSKALDIEIGYQTRQVRCTRSDGKNAMLSLCTQDSVPVTFQSCVMPRDCETSHWSPWSPCSKSCRATDLSPGYRIRSRSLKQIPVGGGKECPAFEEKEACNIIGDLLPSCPRYLWKSTDWGDCQVQPLLNPQDRRLSNLSALCGGGIQTRETYCIQVPGDAKEGEEDALSRPVSRRLCLGNSPAAVQPCSIPCPQECLVSLWSPWGPCIHDNCLDPQGKRGFRQRRRLVVREPEGTTQGCPHLVESMPCEDPVCFRWSVSPVSGQKEEELCVPTDGQCGPGTRAQAVRCVDAHGELCPDAPPTTMPCEVPCPGDCVVGSWAAWSPCSHSCSGKNSEGRQSRTLAILALPGQGGKPCPPAAALEEWRSCNTHPCIIFYWETSPWGPCSEDPSAGDLNTTSSLEGTPTCAAGIQTRKVACMKMNVGQVIPKRCPDSSRPDTVRPCLLPCRKDCIVTPFSEWTPCPSTCQPVKKKKRSYLKIIIQRPSDGGQECPDTLHEERECESLPVCPTYRWKTHKWHQCTLVPESVRQGLTGMGESCGRGLEIRAVTCVGNDDEPANMTECLQWAGTMPLQVRPCQVPCKDDCTFSNWSKFTDCSGCGGWRTRKRTLTGRSKKLLKCQKSELYPLVEAEPCTCLEFQAEPQGNWSSCVLPETHGWRAQREARECGQGLRYRAIACTDQDGRLVNPALCGGSGYVEEVCHIPCPLDCKLSDWSTWSACSAPCGSGVKVRSKWLREKAFNGGRPCPKLDLKNQVYEAVPCYSECNEFTWAPEPWSACAVNTVGDPPACGEGVQTRKVRCIQKDTGNIMDDGPCDPEEAPPSAQTCFLPCPEDCVMSEWSQWSACTARCDPDTSRKRFRRILRLSRTGRDCPGPGQTESCVLNSTCFSYRYNLSDWSTCLLSESAICGQGVRMRQLDCVRSDGKVVDLSVCEELGLRKQWKLTTTCVVDCPVNCLLSEWTPWSECSLTCGLQGQMVRSRSVIQPAHEQGRPCPSQLSQTKPCPIRPCYSWLLSEWSSCRTEGADCGEGVRERNLTCVVHGGDSTDLSTATAVDPNKCEEKLRITGVQELQVPCLVPCPGDCHLTEWAPWSSCQLTCLNGRGFEATGQQARSRSAVLQVLENQDSCPQQEFETRPCKDGKCYSYEWQTGSWRANGRSVWCQRSDGVNVTGGCFLQDRPTTVRHCHPPCTKPFSHCTQRGVCGCEAGYTEVMTAHGFLDYCTRTPGADNKKADVKINTGRLRPGTTQAGVCAVRVKLPLFWGADGRIKPWVYGVTAGVFALILFVIGLSFLMCKSPSPPQKPLTLAYDGDMDM